MSNTTASSMSTTYRRLLRCLRPYKAYVFFGLLAIIATAVIDSCYVRLVQPLVDQVFVAKQAHWMRYIPFLMMALFVLRACSSFVSTYFMNRATRFVVAGLRQSIFDRLLHLPFRYLASCRSGHLVTLLTYHTEQVSQSTAETLLKAFGDMALILGMLYAMLAASWQMTGLIVIAAPLVCLVLRHASRRGRSLSHRVQASVARLASLTQEFVRAMVLIRLHGAQSSVRSDFHEQVESNRQQSLKVVVTNALSSVGTQLIISIPIALIVLIAAHGWVTISAGAFASLLSAMLIIVRPIKRFSGMTADIARGVAGADSIFSLLDQPEESSGGEKELAEVRGEYAVKNLSYYYDDHTQVLDSVSLSLGPNSVVGLVGSSGSGKSTLAKILTGLYTDYSGTITLDGIGIDQLSLTSYREKIAYVSQDPVIFDTTVRENVSFGSACDEARVWEALRLAQLEEWILSQPLGLDTNLGEMGSQLSGGQRQRLAIARAIYRDAPITVFDEATSALDYETENRLQAALQPWASERTWIVIAHRLSTVRQADTILVLSEGRLVEQGTHLELMRRKQYYYDLYQSQHQGHTDHEISA